MRGSIIYKMRSNNSRASGLVFLIEFGTKPWFVGDSDGPNETSVVRILSWAGYATHCNKRARRSRQHIKDARL